jgi:alkanesulfonate monooxygenase SsuD/methylene tetrahydromethanopterin reductase-like flavin-dependent oxidoreductase (luciferase family)
MRIGMALPTMAAGYTGPLLREWCAGVDDGPFGSISTGERLTFVNPELITTLSACAALTSRVEVLANIVVAGLHRPVMLAKQLATIDVLSEGRLVVGLGVGGRPHDYRAVDAPFVDRHATVDALAADLRGLWGGAPPFEGADPVGPSCTRPQGPPLLAGAMGPKGLGRAAHWADGISGFSVSGDPGEVALAALGAREAWAAADRATAPWLGSGTFCTLGVEDSVTVLRDFAATYLGFLGPELATALAGTLTVATPAELDRVLDGAEAAGLDEFTLVPGTWDLRCLEAIADVVARRGLPSTAREVAGQ